jgi:hypothetical protein
MFVNDPIMYMEELLNYNSCYPPILIEVINANKPPKALDSYNITA